ncbi:hypothetical protein Hypma_016099 [Hypsizygus marmoreus]|uniref:Thermolabile hemolysin n=1 Tax=Hypsizygus marmoreus TaxID=39966 RepID=A0A369K577_HYPMA|nr:hypothetical protein Hypma_016099 [Hypsizygus marmoreus]
MFFSLGFVFAAISTVSAAVLRRGVTDVHLAVNPKCGTLSGSPADVNAGLRSLNVYKTIVSFGDAYTDGGVRDGSPLKPAVLVPPSPKAGGRLSNGPIWVENLAKNAGAVLKDYAADGAVVDAGQYPSNKNLNSVNDLIRQINLFIGQGNRPAPDTTLYTLFFGIGDYEEGGDLNIAAQNIIYNILVLSSSPTFARNILIVDNYGRGKKTAAGEAFKQQVFSGVNALRQIAGLNVGFVDFANVWNGVLGSTPGYTAFGYTNPGACAVSDTTTDGACSDPDHSFYWIPGTPSAATHRIMADYVNAVITQCKV